MTALTVKVTANQRLSRTAKLCQNPLSRPDNIANTSDRVDQPLLKSSINFRAQAMHQHINHVGLRIETKVPDVFQDHCFGDGPSAVPQQQFEQSKLTRLQFNLLSGTNNLPGE